MKTDPRVNIYSGRDTENFGAADTFIPEDSRPSRVKANVGKPSLKAPLDMFMSFYEEPGRDTQDTWLSVPSLMLEAHGCLFSL